MSNKLTPAPADPSPPADKPASGGKGQKRSARRKPSGAASIKRSSKKIRNTRARSAK